VIVGRPTHDYLICVASGRVVEFSSERFRKVRDEICREHGFEAISHQLQIFGISAEARAEKGAVHLDMPTSPVKPQRRKLPGGNI
jgi:Fe2+ or Zn2+ uptake regulation protein